MPSLVESLFKVKVSSKGQLVIPKPIRKALNLYEGDELLLVPTKDGILLKHPGEQEPKLRGLLKGIDIDIAACEAILDEARRSLAKVTVQ